MTEEEKIKIRQVLSRAYCRASVSNRILDPDLIEAFIEQMAEEKVFSEEKYRDLRDKWAMFYAELLGGGVRWSIKGEEDARPDAAADLMLDEYKRRFWPEEGE